MEEQQKMNSDDEELFNRYFAKIKSKAKETLAQKHDKREAIAKKDQRREAEKEFKVRNL